MIRKEVDVHLEALAGYINDEDKLVTYKWLSKELSIHVNLSKQILFEYWNNHREENNSVTATFLLIGYLEDGGMRVEVVKEEDLASAKSNFSKIISEHVYSLQKSLLPDLELLAITDKGNSEYSAVRCNEAVVRSDHEMEVLRWGSKLTDKNIQSSASKVQKTNNNEAKLTSVDQTDGGNKESVPKSTASKPVAAKTQKSAFNNLFAKAIDKQNKEKSTTSVSSNNVKNKTSVSKTVSNKSPQKNAWFEAAKKPKLINEQPESSKESVNPTKKQKISVIVDSDDSDEAASPPKNEWFESKKKLKEQADSSKAVTDNKSDDEKGKRKSPEKSTTSSKTGGKKKQAASSARGKKRQSSSKAESTSKRRKRIVVAVSSEESSDSETEDINEPESPEEEPQVIKKVNTCPSPPLVKCEGGRRKVRKLVDKTFMDEDGYFVTQKEYVYESCSDKEEEAVVETVKPSTSEPTAVKNTNKRKQATLLNFFKKS